MIDDDLDIHARNRFPRLVHHQRFQFRRPVLFVKPLGIAQADKAVAAGVVRLRRGGHKLAPVVPDRGFDRDRTEIDPRLGQGKGIDVLPRVVQLAPDVEQQALFPVQMAAAAAAEGKAFGLGVAGRKRFWGKGGRQPDLRVGEGAAGMQGCQGGHFHLVLGLEQVPH